MRSTYMIRGTKDGNPIKATVDASSETSARNKAAHSGIVVDHVEVILPMVKSAPPAMPPPVPVVARPTSVDSIIQSVEQPGTAIPIWHKFIDAGQDSGLVAKLHHRLLSVLTASEDVLYIGVQQKPVVNVAPDAVALTTRRVIVFRQKMLGRMDMEDFLWLKLDDAKLKENILGATLTFRSTDGQVLMIDHIPKQQARTLYRHAQEQEEIAMMQRRGMDLEMVRAGATGVQLNVPQFTSIPPQEASAALPDDPIVKMKKIKSLLEAGLITQAEFDAKRDEVMKSI